MPAKRAGNISISKFFDNYFIKRMEFACKVDPKAFEI